MAVILEFASRSTTLFAPDEVVTPVPPLATGKVPVTPAVKLTCWNVGPAPELAINAYPAVPAAVDTGAAPAPPP